MKDGWGSINSETKSKTSHHKVNLHNRGEKKRITTDGLQDGSTEGISLVDLIGNQTSKTTKSVFN